MTYRIKELAPQMIGRKIRQKGRVDSRKNLFARFKNLDFEGLLSEARQYWSTNTYVPSRKPPSKERQKVQITLDLIRRGQLSKALKRLDGNEVIDSNQITPEVLLILISKILLILIFLTLTG